MGPGDYIDTGAIETASLEHKLDALREQEAIIEIRLSQTDPDSPEHGRLVETLDNIRAVLLQTEEAIAHRKRGWAQGGEREPIFEKRVQYQVRTS